MEQNYLIGVTTRATMSLVRVFPLSAAFPPDTVVNIVLLLGSFGFLLLGAELFTNGVEWLGHRLGVSESATGSILAAVGTALPETTIPVIAILQGVATGDMHAADEVGVGAILGAPFLLSTIALFLIGSAVLYFSERRTRGATFHFDDEATRRDLSFFLVGYSLAVLAALVPSRSVSVGIAIVLVGLYGVYVYRSLRSGELIEGGELDGIYLGVLANRVDLSGNPHDLAADPPRRIVLVQTLAALAFIIGGAQLFVTEIEFFSAEVLDVPTAIVALLLAPLATELPEKINSVIWISKDKDTLAIGNVTGAMVFQGTVPVTLGILFTSWNLSVQWGTTGFLNSLSAVLTITSGGLLYLRARSIDAGTMRPVPFLVGGVFYVVFLAVTLFHVFVLQLPGASGN